MIFSPSAITLTNPLFRPSGGGEADPLFADVDLLLNFEADSGTTVTDVSGASTSMTVVNGTVSTAQAKAGSKSVLFASGDNGYLQTSTTLVLGTGDYTLEGWFYPTADYTPNIPQDPFIMSGFFSGRVIGVKLNEFTEELEIISASGGTTTFTGAGPVVSGTWNHIALERVSGVTTAYVNGVAGGTTLTDTRNLGTLAFRIGGDPSVSARYMEGYVDDVRFTIGSARYNGNFTPPESLPTE